MKLKVPKTKLTESYRSFEIMLELGIINLLTLFKLKSLKVYKITQKVCGHCKQCVLNYRERMLTYSEIFHCGSAHAFRTRASYKEFHLQKIGRKIKSNM